MAEAYNRSIQNRHFAKQQSAFGTAASAFAATDAFKALDDEAVKITGKYEDIKRADNKSGRDPLSKVAGKKGPHEWNIAAYVVPYGTAGTAPDIDPIMESAFVKTTTTQFTLTGTPTDTILYTTTTGAVVAGDVIFVPISSGTTYEAARVSTVTSASGTDTITLSTALTFTPVATDVIPAAVQYKPRNDVSASKYFTLARIGLTEAEYLSDCILDSFKVECGGQSELVKQTLSGFGAHHVSNAYTTLATGINDAVTSMEVTNINFLGQGATYTDKVVIEAEGVNTAETVTVTAFDFATSTATITRGTPASAHGAGAAIRPYQPSETTSGSPIPGVRGHVSISGTQFPVTQLSFEDKENFLPVEYYGEDEVKGYAAPASREAKATCTVYGQAGSAYLKPALESLGLAGNADTMFQYGNQSGKAMAVSMPAVLWGNPVLSESNNSLIHAALESKFVFGVSGDDAFTIAYL